VVVVTREPVWRVEADAVIARSRARSRRRRPPDRVGWLHALAVGVVAGAASTAVERYVP
jgi:hypothetical protein